MINRERPPLDYMAEQVAADSEEIKFFDLLGDERFADAKSFLTNLRLYPERRDVFIYDIAIAEIASGLLDDAEITASLIQTEDDLRDSVIQKINQARQKADMQAKTTSVKIEAEADLPGEALDIIRQFEAALIELDHLPAPLSVVEYQENVDRLLNEVLTAIDVANSTTEVRKLESRIGKSFWAAIRRRGRQLWLALGLGHNLRSVENVYQQFDTSLSHVYDDTDELVRMTDEPSPIPRLIR